MSVDTSTAGLFLDIALIVALARAMGMLFTRLGQPAVIGEIMAGIALGPTVLGAFPGNLTEVLFGPDILGPLRVVGDLALVLFMFMVGWDLDLGFLRVHERTAVTISLMSACVPFVLGVALAFALHGSHGVVDGHPVGLTPFALFIGASMSITAFPVLARILVERGMERGALGTLALACAAVDDAVGWTLVVVVLAVVASTGPLEWARMLVELAVFLLVLAKVIRPALAWALDPMRGWIRRDGQAMAAVLVAGALACAATTALIGLHFVIGAFAFGLAVPREGLGTERVARARGGLAPLVGLLLPVYFVLPGLNVDVSSLSGADVAEFVAVTVVACAGKLGGAVAGARLRHVEWRRSLAIGALMNTRGLIELVVLTIGFEHGVLDRSLFTILVLMAVVTTLLTAPALRLIYCDDAPPHAWDSHDVAAVTAVAGGQP